MSYPARAKRVTFQDEAMLQFEGEMVWCTTQNLSVTGMAMTCPIPVPVRSQVLLGFNLDPFAESESTQAVVVRARTTHEGCCLGVQFKGMDADLFSRLSLYVRQNADTQS